MPEHNFHPIRGKLERFSFSSKLLHNSLGDPVEREVMVHIPTQGIEILDGGDSLPVMIYLAPFTSSGLARAGWKAFAETLPQRHERLVSQGLMKPTILVMPDCFTSLGGNQFVDSKTLGQWSSWLHKDLKTQISTRYNCNGRFALFGKSSGGYGAIHNAIHHPGEWFAIASHSGDVGFDTLYRSDFHQTATHISKFGDLGGFLKHIKNTSKLSSGDFHSLMICAMAASYDSATEFEGGFTIKLPFDLQYCQIDEGAWGNWKLFDPLVSLKNNIDSLKSLNLLYIDCGDMDQYGIQYGSRTFVKMLGEYGIKHQWEEFSGTHSSIEHRLDISMPLLSEVLHS